MTRRDKRINPDARSLQVTELGYRHVEMKRLLCLAYAALKTGAATQPQRYEILKGVENLNICTPEGVPL